MVYFINATSLQLEEEKLREAMNRYKFGSLFNPPYWKEGGPPGGWSPSKWRQIVGRAQEIAAESGSGLPVIFALDSVHGANYIGGAVMFPHPIATAASFNASVAREAGRVAAKDTRAAGIPWLFAPVVEVAAQPQWARTFETFGEDPYLASQMGAATISGIQASQPGGPDADDGEPLRAAACFKHFIGYSGTVAGKDRAPALIPERELQEIFLPPFQAAVRAGALTGMESYNDVDGLPVVSSQELLRDVLRGRLGFRGMLVTDYNEVRNLVDWHRVAADNRTAVRTVLADTTVDMSMAWDGFAEHAAALVRSGSILESRLDASVRRILALKEAVGLFDIFYLAAAAANGSSANGSVANALATAGHRMLATAVSAGAAGTSVWGKESLLAATVGSAQDIKAAQDAARDSITLLKNDNGALPLRRSNGTRIAVAGESCNSMALQAGGWSVHWQGAANDSDMANLGVTILDGLRASAGGGVDVVWHNAFSVGGERWGAASSNVGSVSTGENSTAAAAAGENDGTAGGVYGAYQTLLADAAGGAVDAIVLCVGEHTYTEKPGDVASLALPPGVVSVVTEVASAAAQTAPPAMPPPVVLVLVEGRPRMLGEAAGAASSIVNTYLPGPWGGTAVAEVLFGDVNPSGRLPITYPKHPGNIPMAYDHKPSLLCGHASLGYSPCEVEWWFGEGLSYTNFTTTTPRLNATALDENGALSVSVTVRNVGAVPGKTSVLLFLFDLFRRTTPRYKQLVRFNKVFLRASESADVTFELPAAELQFVGAARRLVLENGEFRLGIGPHVDCRLESSNAAGGGVTDDGSGGGGCSSFKLQLSSSYSPVCESACALWFPARQELSSGNGTGSESSMGAEEGGFYSCPDEAAGVFDSHSACMGECRAAAVAIVTGAGSAAEDSSPAGEGGRPQPAANTNGTTAGGDGGDDDGGGSGGGSGGKGPAAGAATAGGPWDWNFVECLEEATFSGRCGFTARCRRVGQAATMVLHATPVSVGGPAAEQAAAPSAAAAGAATPEPAAWSTGFIIVCLAAVVSAAAVALLVVVRLRRGRCRSSIESSCGGGGGRGMARRFEELSREASPRRRRPPFEAVQDEEPMAAMDLQQSS